MAEHVTYDTVVMFADVAGSSKLYKQVGDEEANRQISDVVTRLMNATMNNNGVVIKTIGDEVMAHFRNPNDAQVAAISMQQVGEETLPIRIGMAWGNVIEKDNDLFGQAVNDAAAVAKIARGRQIITTDVHKDQLAAAHVEKLSVFDEVKLKGGNTVTTLYRIEWESQNEDQGGSDHTVIMTKISSVQNQLVLSYSAHDGSSGSMTLTEENTPIHIGRDDTSCQLVMPTALASRDHCSIDYQYGKFVLTDHSTNGTYVRNNEGQEVYLRREELPLLGSGCIGLGEQADPAGQFAIKFYS
jgi:class 3 adenylate cyclase